MAINTAAELLAALALRFEAIEVRGQKVHVREMTARARSEIYKAMRESPLTANTLCAFYCLVSPEGRPLFKAGELDLVEDFMNVETIDAVAKKVMQLAGIGDDGATAAPEASGPKH